MPEITSVIAGEIEHKDLPDNLLHEPKGALTADVNTVYVADGFGSGQFKKLPTVSLDVVKTKVDSVAVTPITDTKQLSGVFAEIPDGTLMRVSQNEYVPKRYTDTINKNFVELLELYRNQKEINKEIKELMLQAIASLNQAIVALKEIGAAE